MLAVFIGLFVAGVAGYIGFFYGLAKGALEWLPTQERYEAEMNEKLAEFDRMVREINAKKECATKTP